MEAERQLAGAAAAPGEAPLAPPHLTNKGLVLFRSQVQVGAGMFAPSAPTVSHHTGHGRHGTKKDMKLWGEG